MKHLFQKAVLAVAIVLAAAACSPTADDLMETVPADSRFVSVVDLNRLASAADIKIDGGTVTLPESLKSAFPRVSDDMLRTAAMIGEAVDLHDIVVFGAPGDDALITFRVKDADRLDEVLKNESTKSAKGFDVTALGSGLSLAVKGEQGWILRSSDPAAELTELLKTTSKKNITAVYGVAQFMENTDAPVLMAVCRTPSDDPAAGEWMCGALRVESKTLFADVKVMAGDGNPVEFGGLQTLQTDFLRYVPAECNFAFAAGATPQTDWSMLRMAVDASGDPQLQGLFGTLEPYFKKADGTVGFAATVNPDDLGSSGSTFVMMLHMPQADVDAAIGEVAAKIAEAGGTPRRDDKGGVSIVTSSGSLYAANVDGYLGISTLPFVPTRENQLNPYFLSRHAALYLSLPSLPLLGVDDQVTFSVAVKKNSAEVKLTTAEPLARLLVTMFMSLL